MRSTELYKHAIERLSDVTGDLHNPFAVFCVCFFPFTLRRKQKLREGKVITAILSWQRGIEGGEAILFCVMRQ